MTVEGSGPNQEIPKIISRTLTTQQAFPKSAILTLIWSALSGSRGLTSRDPAVSLPTSEKRERESDREIRMVDTNSQNKVYDFI